jgi:hypothetical protein
MKYLLAAWFFMFLPLKAISGEEALFWYDEEIKINLWVHGYSTKHESSIYSESPNPKATKQVLTGRIIIVFSHKITEDELQIFMAEHNLALVGKLKAGNTAYLFKIKGENNDSLQKANNIYKESKVKASYPDWMYLVRDDN